MQYFLKNKYGLGAKFIHHPFYPYKNFESNTEVEEESENFVINNNNDKRGCFHIKNRSAQTQMLY